MTFRTKSGEARHLLVNSEIITYGGAPAVLNVSLDITERKQIEAQQEARRAEAETLARAKDEFLAMLGHELRNPLGTRSPTRSPCSTVSSPMPTCAASPASSTGRRRTSRRLVDDLLDVARVTSGKIELRPQPVDLRELARPVARGAAGRPGARRGTRSTVEGEPRPRPRRSGAARAGDQQPRRQRAQVHAGAAAQVAVIIERAGTATRCCACGTPARASAPTCWTASSTCSCRSRRRSTARAAGLGLGLTLVRRLVELHGGSVVGGERGARARQRVHGALPAAADAGRRRIAPAAAPPRR